MLDDTLGSRQVSNKKPSPLVPEPTRETSATTTGITAQDAARNEDKNNSGDEARPATTRNKCQDGGAGNAGSSSKRVERKFEYDMEDVLPKKRGRPMIDDSTGK